MKFFLSLMLFFITAMTAYAQDALCPDVDQLISQSPQTMLSVQSDINRIRLCVERATLLKQLDEVALQRKEILQKVQSTTIPSNSLPVPIPQLPVDALDELEEIPTTKNMPARTNDKQAWSIRKIWGQNQSMSAQLVSSDNKLLNVVRGDSLPDGFIVESITALGVTASLNGDIKTLEWEQLSGIPQ